VVCARTRGVDAHSACAPRPREHVWTLVEAGRMGTLLMFQESTKRLVHEWQIRGKPAADRAAA